MEFLMNCKLCNIGFKNDNDMVAHLSGDRHKSNALKFKNGELIPPPPTISQEPVVSNGGEQKKQIKEEDPNDSIPSLLTLNVAHPSVKEEKVSPSKRWSNSRKRKQKNQNNFSTPPSSSTRSKRSNVEHSELVQQIEGEIVDLFCDVCNIKVNGSSMLEHRQSRRHVEHLNQGRRESDQAEFGIFVKYSKPLTSDDIYDYFSRYGRIRSRIDRKFFTILNFDNSNVVDAIMSERHAIGGQNIFVNRKKSSKGKTEEKRVRPVLGHPKVEPTEKPIMNVIEKLRSTQDPSEQFLILLNELQPNKEMYFDMYQDICHDLHQSLRPKYPHNSVHPFGSTVTGLNFRTSDLDVFIYGVREEKDNQIAILRRMKQDLFNSGLFSNLLVITARTPILRCIHRKTRMSCDINIKNMLGVCNSNLVKSYLNLDEKAFMLMLILKYWGMIHAISGKPHLITNYALSILVVFYFQQRAIGCPPVWELQKDEVHVENIQDGWDGGFAPIPPRPPMEVSMIDMLFDFFDFYCRIDYKSDVISPFYGNFLKKSDFSNIDALPREFARYKLFTVSNKTQPLKISPLTIQDPFEHSRNIASGVNESLLNRFVLHCELGRELCGQGEHNLLFRLFTEEPQAVIKEDIESGLGQFFITRSSNAHYLRKTTEHARNCEWFETVHNFVLIVLRSFLRITVEDVNIPVSQNKSMRYDGQSDVYNIGNKSTFKCTITENVWSRRKNVENKLKEQLSVIPKLYEREKVISDYILTHFKKKSQNVTEKIVFYITMEHKVNPQSFIEFRLEKVEAYKRMFKSFNMFLGHKLPQWFEVYERELNRNH